MKKKHTWIKVVAILAAVAAIAVAVIAFLKRKGKKIKEELDFDEELLYFDSEEDFDDDIMSGDATIGPEDMDDDMMPEESEDSIITDATEEK